MNTLKLLLNTFPTEPVDVHCRDANVLEHKVHSKQLVQDPAKKKMVCTSSGTRSCASGVLDRNGNLWPDDLASACNCEVPIKSMY